MKTIKNQNLGVSVFFRVYFLFIALLFQSPAQSSDNLGYARALWLSNLQIRLTLNPLATQQNKLFFFLTQKDPQELNLRNLVSTQNDFAIPLISSQGSFILLDGKLWKKDLPNLIRGPLTLIVTNESSQLVDKTSLQLAPVLDTYFSYTGDLGLIWKQNKPQFALWAPTAVSVRLKVFNSDQKQDLLTIQEMTLNQQIWTTEGTPGWKNKYYLYEVVVFHPLSQKVETFEVTDPYSMGLSTNSAFSQIINPDDSELKPPGWDRLTKPPLASLTDASIYEIHLRDWTAGDPKIPPLLRGTFKGLIQPGSNSFEYLKQLAQAGLTHVHLMPLADFATVDENKENWKFLAAQPNTPPYSPYPQGEMDKIKDQDAYNWGYDPVHWLTPEGSYSSSTDGRNRIYELREMIMGLNAIGLRVVQDVVFNHSYENGIARFSVLDKIVPLYYYRLDPNGVTYNSSCCADTATENLMMEKLMIDALRYWAIEFKMDGFRFDLMNLHTLKNMEHVQQSLRNLQIKANGVDGSRLLLYGEAWEFGSLESKFPGSAFFQTRAGGEGYGVFNDRIRDALRGGTTNTKEKSDPGFLTGLFYDFNQDPSNRNTPINSWDQRIKLLHLADVIKIGIAGNLKNFGFYDFKKNWISAQSHFFRGLRTPLAQTPEETINYISAHDGYSLWDSIEAKLPFQLNSRFPNTASEDERVRAARMGLAIVALSQGIPFFENGGELLRSRSGAQDGYNSGDWFNHIDFSFNTNNWGVGLPPHWKNIDDWYFWRPRLSSAELQASKESILETARYFFALLTVRHSSPLFRLPTLELIQKNLTFPWDDQTQDFIPGLIAMSLENKEPYKTRDTQNQRLIIFFNATNSKQRYQLLNLKNKTLFLHPDFTEAIDSRLRTANFDSESGIFELPERTTVIFQEKL